MRYALVELNDEKDEYKSNLEDSVKLNQEWETKFISQNEVFEGLSKFVKAAGQTAKKIQERFIKHDFTDLSDITQL